MEPELERGLELERVPELERGLELEQGPELERGLERGLERRIAELESFQLQLQPPPELRAPLQLQLQLRSLQLRSLQLRSLQLRSPALRKLRAFDTGAGAGEEDVGRRSLTIRPRCSRTSCGRCARCPIA